FRQDCPPPRSYESPGFCLKPYTANVLYLLVFLLLSIYGYCSPGNTKRVAHRSLLPVNTNTSYETIIRLKPYAILK
ncbi:MAG TPA: hypothetical protein VK666_21810, partial [Chryseolinea sp.]|nr:hypothetical protein [Chryseolinea sp.]